MFEIEYRNWLTRRGDMAATVSTSLATVRRLETAYGDLDTAFTTDLFEGIQSELAYSSIDQRNNEPNPSRLTMSGDLYKGLASCRTHLRKYSEFLEARRDGALHADTESDTPVHGIEQEMTFGLEKDMQAALRDNIAQLEPGLEIIDGGNEHHVASGFIDILARDATGQQVVIELKAVKAPLAAQSQIASYMGDIMAETGTMPRGILVAPDFDAKLISAARVMPSLSLTRYHYSFSFEPVA